jgi:hypothetical protein
MVSAVQVAAGVPRHSGHDVEVLRRQRCEQLGTAAPFWWAARGVCGVTDESPARLWSVPATTAPVAVVLLLGGVAEVRRYFSRSPSSLEVVSGRKPRSGLDRRDGGVLDVVPLLGASRSGAWWRSYVTLLRCLSLFKAGLWRRYARHSGRVQDNDFSGPTKFRHLLL